MGLTSDIPPVRRIPLIPSPVSTVLWKKITSLSCVLSLRPDRKYEKEVIQGASKTNIPSYLMHSCPSYTFVKMLQFMQFLNWLIEFCCIEKSHQNFWQLYVNFHQKANRVLTESPRSGELVLLLTLKYQKGAVFLLQSLRRRIHGHHSPGLPCNHTLLYEVDAKVLALWKVTLPGPLCSGSQLIFCSSYMHKTHLKCLSSILNLVGLLPEDSYTENFCCQKAARVILG